MWGKHPACQQDANPAERKPEAFATLSKRLLNAINDRFLGRTDAAETEHAASRTGHNLDLLDDLFPEHSPSFAIQRSRQRPRVMAPSV